MKNLKPIILLLVLSMTFISCKKEITKIKKMERAIVGEWALCDKDGELYDDGDVLIITKSTITQTYKSTYTTVIKGPYPYYLIDFKSHIEIIANDNGKLDEITGRRLVIKGRKNMEFISDFNGGATTFFKKK